jgi:fumarate reductase subunit D
MKLALEITVLIIGILFGLTALDSKNCNKAISVMSFIACVLLLILTNRLWI